MMTSATETLSAGGTLVTVRFPTSYGTTDTQRFPLLLVLEAQPGIDSADAVEWGLHLHASGLLPEMIVAAIPAGREGNVQTMLAVARDLSARLRLLEEPAARWVAGSGHDAVDALRATIDHPGTFGRAACLSSSFEGLEGAPPLHSPMLLELESRPALPGGVRLCFDYGTVGIDECYEPYHRDLGAILRGKGWNEGMEFTITRSKGGSDDPGFRKARLGRALRWLAGH